VKTEIAASVPGGSPLKKRPRKAFPLGAPRALVAPLEALLSTARQLADADRATAYSLEGREVSLLAKHGDGSPQHSRLVARALAEGIVLTESTDDGYIQAVPMAASPPPGSERRRFQARTTVASACLVVEGSGDAPADGFAGPAATWLGQSILAAVEARAFADAVATDRTTGALNRAAFENAAAHELALADAADRPAAMVLIEVVSRRTRVEVDSAEEALYEAALGLRAALRADDLVGRRGPDELAALLNGIDAEHVPTLSARIFEQIQARLDALGLDAPVIGVAAFPTHGQSLEDIDQAALAALESARESEDGGFRIYDPRLGASPTASRHSFFTGDPGLDARKSSLLFESVLAANTAREPHQVSDAVLRALFAATGADRAAILLGDGADLEVTAARDLHWNRLEPPLRISRSACLRALALGRATCSADEVGKDDHSPAFGLQPQSSVTVPLLGRDGPIGVLYADSLRRAFKNCRPEDLAYLEALAAQVARAIENVGALHDLAEENDALKRLTRGRDGGSMLLGSSPAMSSALAELPLIVDGDASVVVVGEPGTGKRLLANTIHRLGPRAGASFVAQDCATIPAEMLASEIFGHASGAISDATRAKRGLLELADGGTLFLDHIEVLSPTIQAQLETALRERQVQRLGAHRATAIDVRLICATALDLVAEVRAGRFDGDLLRQLDELRVEMPPLRERLGDIPELAGHLAARAAERLGRPRTTLTTEALDQLRAHSWPGNVAELANLLDKAVAIAREGRLEPVHLGLEHQTLPAAPPSGTLREILAGVEREHVVDALRASDGNVSAAARTLGVARQQLQRLMRKYRLRSRRG